MSDLIERLRQMRSDHAYAGASAMAHNDFEGSNAMRADVDTINAALAQLRADAEWRRRAVEVDV